MATPVVAVNRRAKALAQSAAIEQDIKRMVARELHDRVAQTLTGMLVDLENFKSQEVEWDDVLRQLDTVQSSTRQVLASLRQLLHGLRGEQEVANSFGAAISELLGRFEEKSGITARLEVKPGWPEVLTPPAALNLYRIVEEALNNVRMHSEARSVLVVLQQRSEDEVALTVKDDGRGLDTDVSRPVGLGTIGMKERAVFLGGRLRVESEPGRGTAVQAVFRKDHLVPDREFSLSRD